MSADAAWPAARLGDHASIKARIGWKGLQASEYREKGYIFLATPNIKGPRIDFDNVNFISELRYIESPELMLQVGDVLLVKDGSTLGISNLVRGLPGPATVNGSIAVLRCSETLDPAFLHQLTKAHAFQKLIYDKKSGIGVPHLFQADLREFEIPFPSLAEQHRIAQILDTLDETIRRTEQVIAKMQRMKQGLLQDLLTRGLDDNGELRDPERHPEQFKESRLGRIPSDWTVEVLANVAEVRSGKAKNENKAVNKPIQVHYLRVANVQDGYLDLAEMNILTISRDELDRYSVLPGDVLMNEGGDLDKLGRGCVWHGELSPCIHQNHVFVVRSGPKIDPDFLDIWTGGQIARRYFISVGIQTTNLASINKTALSNLPILLPTLSEQRLILDVIAVCQQRIDGEMAILEKHKAVKNGLMNDLLTARVRIPQTATAPEPAV
ncbi:restriction endonuclease subunit S [Thiocystis violascens]|uniref:Restriction endonuclease S subunit n=1 Tax=Thiocystis violascens (strain ATCC 17096 / DSM 198 / 6111) TaxID=765911 RepID=I3Y969_THIV6|nr:restriction endonuclease subunit S [Thiocystis violascens]AFL73537.1 restriction endonuclease S subunit [Thiocystis violascens DSM 198]